MITSEIITNSNGRQLDLILAYLLYWKDINENDISGINPKFCHEVTPDWNYHTTIPEWSTDLNVINKELKKKYNYSVIFDRSEQVYVTVWYIAYEYGNKKTIYKTSAYSDFVATALTKAFALLLLERKKDNGNHNGND